MSRHRSGTQEETWKEPTRRITLSLVLWAFGFATTMLLIGLWGRAVTHDDVTMQASVRSVVDASVASERIHAWIETGVIASSEADPELTERILAELRDHPEVEAAIGSVLDQFVAALFLPEGEGASIELAATLEPIVPLVAAGFRQHAVPIDEAALVDALRGVAAINLDTPQATTVVGAVKDARAFLSMIVVIAAATMILSGCVAIWLTENRLAMVRNLATRILLSSLTFAILFRVGSWALDPDGGRSSVAGGGAILLRSNGSLFLLVALIAGVVAGSVGWILWRRPKLAVNDALIT
ncbi:MAG: hypothetical protein QGD89_08955 [Actinomycetota bacterium]|nr:hypothetical protein [Actinomycetota bacterium]